jgi:phosphatidylinositol alpha-1,6-mannosyltransferase
LERAARDEGHELGPVSVVPPPVPPLRTPSAEDVAAERAALDLTRSDRIVLYPGDLEVSCGAEVTRSLVDPVLELDPRAVVVFAYRNKTPRAAERAAALKGALAGRRVRFTDRVSNMHALLQASGIVIFPVDDLWGKVDQPIVLLEAMALGTPCVVLDQGPLKDVVGAVKMPTIDIRSWRDAVASLLTDPSARDSASAAGRTAAREVYASGVVARAYEAIYLRALERAR